MIIKLLTRTRKQGFPINTNQKNITVTEQNYDSVTTGVF